MIRYSCPPSHRWAALLADDLPPTEQADLNGHLELCPACQRALEDCAAHRDAWAVTARSLGHPGVTRDHALRDVIDRMKLDPESDHDTRDGAELPIDFLDPPSEPPGSSRRSLGRIHQYEVLEEVGRGGMGVVLKALDPGLHRVVAIKVLAPQLAVSGTARKRFTREARAAAAVGHENVVTIHAVEEFKGLPYLVMQYIAGPSVQQRLADGGPLPVAEIPRIGFQTAAGLAAAHAQGLVHRDVKPANILLENGVERVKLTDFSLARAIDDASVTQTGVVTGTPPYMAPEQARGEPLDHRADLFSLGSVLYALCTGRPPFRGQSLDVLRKVSEETPVSIRTLNPEIPAWLDAIVKKLMAKKPEDRYQSAGEVAALLERCLAHVQQPTAVPLPEGIAAKRSFGWRAAGLVPAVLIRTAGPRTAGTSPAARRWIWGAAAVTAMLLGVTILRLKTTDGTLEITLDDPQAKVTVDGTDIVVTGLTGVQEFRLKSGDYTVHQSKDGKPEKTEIVAIKQGEKTPLRVTFEPTGGSNTGNVPMLSAIPGIREIFQTQQQKALAERSVADDRKTEARKLLALLEAEKQQRLQREKSDPPIQELEERIAALRKSLGDHVLGGRPGNGQIRPAAPAAGMEQQLEALNRALQSRAAMENLKAAEEAQARLRDIQNLLGTLEGQQRTLLETLGREHPKVKDLEARIADIRKQIESATVATFDKARVTQPQRTFPTECREVSSAVFSPDGKQLFIADWSGVIFAFDFVTGKEAFNVHTGRADARRSLAVSPDGKTLAAIGGLSTIQFIDVRVGKIRQSLSGKSPTSCTVAFSADGKTFAAGGFGPDGKGGLLEMWDLATSQKRTVEFASPVRALASPPGREDRIAVGTDGDDIRMVYPSTGKVEYSLTQPGPVRVLTFSPDGHWLAASTGENQIHLWNWQSGRDSAMHRGTDIFGRADRITFAEFSPDGTRLVTASADGTAKLWSMAKLRGPDNGKLVATIAPEKANVGIALFTPDGKSIVTTGDDGKIRVWDSTPVTGSAAPIDANRTAVEKADADAKLAAAELAAAKVKSEAAERITQGAFAAGQVELQRAIADLNAAGQRLATTPTKNEAAFREAQAAMAVAQKRVAEATARAAPLSDQPQRTFSIEAREIASAAISPDGTRLFVADPDGNVFAYDFATGKRQFAFTGDQFGRTPRLAISPDGAALAAAGNVSADGQRNATIHLWDPKTGRLQKTLHSKLGVSYSAIAFSADGKMLAAGGQEVGTHRGLVELWDLASGKARPVELASSVLSLAFPPSREDRLAVGTVEGNVVMVYPSSAEPKYPLSQPAGGNLAIAFSPDGKWLAAGHGDGQVRIWDWQSDRQTVTLIGHDRDVCSVEFSRDGKQLVTANANDRTAKLWDAASGKLVAIFAASTSRALFTPDGKSIVTAGDDGMIRVWDANADIEGKPAADAKQDPVGNVAQPQRSFEAQAGGPILSAAFKRNGKTLVIAGQDRPIQQIGVVSGTATTTPRWGDSALLAMSPDGKEFATVANDGIVHRWSAGPSGGEISPSLRPDIPTVVAIAYGPDGKTFAIGGRSATGGGLVALFDGHSPNASRVEFKSAVLSLAFDPGDRTRMAIGLEKDNVQVINTVTGKLICTTPLAGPTKHMAFSPDGKWFAATRGDKLVLLRDWITGGDAAKIIPAAGETTSVRFSPDGKRLATASADGIARLWEVPSGKLVATFNFNAGKLNVAEFSPDGKWLATAGEDRMIRMWDLTPFGKNTINMFETLAAPEKPANPAQVNPADPYKTDIEKADAQIEKGRRDAKLAEAELAAAKAKAEAAQMLVEAATAEATMYRGLTKNRIYQTPQRSFHPAGGPGNAVLLSADGSLVFVADILGRVNAYDFASGTKRFAIDDRAGSLRTLAISSDGKWLAGPGADSTIQLWDAASGKPDRKLDINAQQISSLVFGPNSKQLAVGGASDNERTMRIWDLTDPNKPSCTYVTTVNHSVNAIAFSRDGKLCAGTTDPTKKDLVWVNYIDGSKKPIPLFAPGVATAVAFSRDGRTVAIAGRNLVGLYDWRSGTRGATELLKGHAGPVNTVSYSPDGRFIATASYDGSARLWDAETGKQVASFAAEKSGYVNTAEFTPDGKSLVTAGEDSVVRIWDLTPVISDAEKEVKPRTTRPPPEPKTDAPLSP